MITTRPAPRTQRLFAVAVILSVVIDLVGGALVARLSHAVAYVMHRLPRQQPREQLVATSDAVTIERRTIPRPAQRQPSARPPRRAARRQAIVRPQPAARPAVAHVPAPLASSPPTPAPHELAHVVKAAPPRPVTHAQTPAPERLARAAPRPRPTVAERRIAAARESAASPSRRALTARQIAQLDAQFSKTIAATHTDLATIQKRMEARPVTTRRMPLQFAGLQGTLTVGQGYISPISAGRRIGNTVWYYTHYVYMWPDGHLESDDIPWPFHFPADRDPFALHWTGLIPLQPPPPGFTVNRPLKPLLARFVAHLDAPQ